MSAAWILASASGCSNANIDFSLLSDTFGNNGSLYVSSGVLKITGPVTGKATSSSIPLQGDCYLDGLTGVTIDGSGASGTQTVPCDSNATFTATVVLMAGEGSKIINVTQTQADGTVKMDSRTFLLDTIAPTVTLTSPTNGLVVNSTAVTVMGACEYGLDVILGGDVTASVTQPCPIAGTYSIAGTLASTEGNRTIAIFQTDNAGNTGAASINVNLDTMGPILTLDTTPVDPSNNATPSFAFSADDGMGSGLMSFECSLDGAAYVACTTPHLIGVGNGNHTFKARAIDMLGNVGTPVSFSWLVDLAPPTFSLTSTPASITNDTTGDFAFSGSDAGSGIAQYQCKIDAGAYAGCTSPHATAALGNGAHTFYMRAIDQAGNTDSPVTHTWTVDTVAPSLSISNPLASSYQTATVPVTGSCESGLTVAITGNVSGSPTVLCSGSAFSIPVTITGADGAKTLAAQQTDGAGNTGSSSNIAFNLDTTPPSVSIDSNPPSWSNTNSPNFTFSGSDSGSGLNGFQCRLDGGTYGACVTPYIPSTPTEGSHTVDIRAFDLLGNTSTAVSYTWSTDLTPGVLNVTTSPAALTNDNTADFVFSGTDTGGSGVSLFQCRLDGGAYNTCSSPYATASLADGGHTMDIRVKDTAGNFSAPSSFSWTVDTVAPTVTITSPAANAYKLASFFVSGACQGVAANLTVTITGDVIGTPTGTCTGSTYNASVTLTAGDGSKVLQASQTDNAGNTGSSATVTVTLDTTSPSMSLTQPGHHYGGDSFSETFSANDGTGSGVSSIVLEFSTDGGTSFSTIGSYGAGATSATVNMPAINTPGARFRLIATDVLGNSGMTATTSFGLMTVLPQFAVAPNWNDYYRRSSTGIACDGTETGTTFNPCMHGGERRMMLVGGKTSCTNLTATDSLGVFTWECILQGGNAHMVSKLARGKGLKDLIANTTSWKTPQLQVFDNGTAMFSGVPSPVPGGSVPAWWSNIVQAAPISTSTVQLMDSASWTGKIGVVPASVTNSAGININANNAALVVLPGGTLKANTMSLSNNCKPATGESASANYPCLVAAGSQQFIWVEGRFDAGDGLNGTNVGLLLTDVKFSVVHGSQIYNGGQVGAWLKGASIYNAFRETRISNSWDGLHVDGTSNNIFRDLNISNVLNTTAGGEASDLWITPPSTNNIYQRIVLSASNYTGLLTDDVAGSNSTDGTVITGLTITNVKLYAAGLFAYTNSILHNALIVGNGVTAGEGLSLGGGVGIVTQSTFSQIGALSSNYLVSAYGGVSSNKITGNLVLGGSGAGNCYLDGMAGTNPGINGTGTCTGSTGSDFLGITGVSGATAFVGKVATTDASNTTNSGGSNAYSASLDWAGFSNPFRNWGMNTGTFPATASLQNACSGGTCRIWDWRIAAADTAFRNKSDDGATMNDSFVDGGTCPSEVSGFRMLNAYGGAQAYLRNAMEILEDAIGDEDGLCETGETCLYTPNLGAYQGEGTLGKCNFADGSISGVTMYGFLTNGGT